MNKGDECSPHLNVDQSDAFECARFPTASRVSQALGEATGKANDPEGAYRRGVTLLLNGLARQRDADTDR